MESRFNTDGQATLQARLELQARDVLGYSIAEVFGEPLHCPWGEKALGGYLGDDRAAWREYDACTLIEDGARVVPGVLTMANQ